MNTLFIVWFFCGIASVILSHGMMLAYFWHSFPTIQSPERFRHLVRRQMLIGVLNLLAPTNIVVHFLMSGCCKHGLLFRMPKI